MDYPERTRELLVDCLSDAIEVNQGLLTYYPEGNTMRHYVTSMVEALSSVRKSIEDNIVFNEGPDFFLQCQALYSEIEIQRQSAELWMETQIVLSRPEGVAEKFQSLGSYGGFHFGSEIIRAYFE